MSSDSEGPLYPCKFIGRTGLRVSPIGLGTMTFGERWKGWTGEQTKEQSEQVFDAYLAAGGNFIDTANNYQFGQSEEWLGEWIEARGIRDQLIVATKFSSIASPDYCRHADGINLMGNSVKSLVVSVRDSLKRLRTDYIDILYVHYWDHSVDPEALMRALNSLVESGKVLHIAISDAPAWIVAQCNTIAKMRGWAQFIAFQGRWSLADRALERDIIPMCRAFDLTVIPWGVLGQGKLTGRYDRGKETGQRSNMVSMSEQDYTVAETVAAIATETGRTRAEVSVAWAYGHSASPVPLLGCRTVQQLETSIGGVALGLTEEQRKRLDDVSVIPWGFPHDFIGHSWEECLWTDSRKVFRMLGSD